MSITHASGAARGRGHFSRIAEESLDDDEFSNGMANRSRLNNRQSSSLFNQNMQVESMEAGVYDVDEDIMEMWDVGTCDLRALEDLKVKEYMSW